jgi:phospholipid-binding lipoprotein MlaA
VRVPVSAPMTAAGALALSLLAACAAPPSATGVNDPWEAQNRQVHAANKAIDRTLFGGGGRAGIVPTLPEPVAEGLGNAASNLGAPANVANSLLQGRVEPAVTNTFRFILNTTLGVGGLFDPATAIGVPKQDTDFGETLAVWGVGEGAYLEVPVLGPSTQRDFAGTVVDVILDPVGQLVGSPESYYVTGARLGGQIGNRQRFADTFESILYDSADSYVQARLLYLQNRRFELGQDSEEIIDPYEDPYAE